jgi:hypothetical protein
MRIGRDVLGRQPRPYIEVGKTERIEKELDLKLFKIRKATERQFVKKAPKRLRA